LTCCQHLKSQHRIGSDKQKMRRVSHDNCRLSRTHTGKEQIS
jgi:hypothetical protein